MNLAQYIKVMCLISSAVCFAGCGDSYGDFLNDPDNAGVAQWATPMETASNTCEFSAVAVDESGNTYAVGHVFSGSFDFGGNSYPFDVVYSSSIIVKYDSSGVVQWAVPITLSSAESWFLGVAVDSCGNAYAAGFVNGTGQYGFGGTSIPFNGASGGMSAVVVKYNSSGIAQWAAHVELAQESCQFSSIAADDQGNTYAAGYVTGTSPFNYGGISVPISVEDTVSQPADHHTVIVKYNSSGVAQWATPIKESSNLSEFNGVAVDNSGNAYAVGFAMGKGSFNFGGSSGSFPGSSDQLFSVIVKYNSTGDAQWATPIKTASEASIFSGVAVDSYGNARAVGKVFGSGVFDFGGENASFSGKSAEYNAVIVKYNSSGVVQWATPVYSSSKESFFSGVAVDVLGNAYAVGATQDPEEFNFGGNSVPFNGNTGCMNSVVVKYNSSGVAQWAIPVKSESRASSFSGVAVDCSGYTYAVGCVNDNDGFFNFGGKSTLIYGKCGNEAGGNSTSVIVKYY